MFGITFKHNRQQQLQPTIMLCLQLQVLQVVKQQLARQVRATHQL